MQPETAKEHDEQPDEHNATALRAMLADIDARWGASAPSAPA